jgi:hypothetical protein
MALPRMRDRTWNLFTNDEMKASSFARVLHGESGPPSKRQTTFTKLTPKVARLLSAVVRAHFPACFLLPPVLFRHVISLENLTGAQAAL